MLDDPAAPLVRKLQSRLVTTVEAIVGIVALPPRAFKSGRIMLAQMAAVVVVHGDGPTTFVRDV